MVPEATSEQQVIEAVDQCGVVLPLAQLESRSKVKKGFIFSRKVKSDDLVARKCKFELGQIQILASIIYQPIKTER
jgi:hypothetical protein